MARPGKLDQDEDQGPGKHVRTTLFQELGEFVLLMGTMATWWQLQIGRAQLQTTLERNRKELNLSREVRVTELFTNATDRLGSESLVIRLGGIYALERIARDSPRDRRPIVEVLSAFVRERARWSGDESLPKRTRLQSPDIDIQAILTVLGRRDATNWRQEEVKISLAHTDLRGADLISAHLEGMIFSEAHLEKADLIEVHLEDTLCNRAHLEGAYLIRAHLERAVLQGANLDGARFDGAHLDGALLNKEHLEGALDLTEEQIESVYTDYEQWERARDEWWAGAKRL